MAVSESVPPYRNSEDQSTKYVIETNITRASEPHVDCVAKPQLTQQSRALLARHGRALDVMKSDDDKRQVFGWASVAVRANGEVIQDWQDDIIDIADLESAAYEFTKEYAVAGEMHERSGVGKLIESFVFTKEKSAALGIPEGLLPEGWWLGFQITDDAVWKKIKDGSYSMFSIEGEAVRVSMEQ